MLPYLPPHPEVALGNWYLHPGNYFGLWLASGENSQTLFLFPGRACSIPCFLTWGGNSYGGLKGLGDL